MSWVTRKHLSRRAVLRGLGASIALPALDAMRPAFAATEAPPLRVAFAYVPNGVTLADWAPKGEGRDFELSRILKPLEPWREQMLVLSGLAHKNGNALGDGPGDHARAGASYLTGVHPRKTAGADIQNGVSVDQVLANGLKDKTRLGSLELGCEESRTVGNCDSGYSCAYTNSISWRSATTPNPPEMNPRMAFERLFGADDVPLDAEARARRARDRRSILDLVSDRTRSLQGELGPADRRKLDEYLTGRAGDRAADRARGARRARRRPSLREAERHSRRFRRLREADVRPAGGGLRGRPHPRLHLHDGARGQPAELPRDRRPRLAPPADPPPWPARPRGARHEDQRLPRRAVRAPGRAACRRTGGRGLSARPYDRRLRQRARRWRPPHPRGPARPRRGWPLAARDGPPRRLSRRRLP